jgi:hypothetical protein
MWAEYAEGNEAVAIKSTAGAPMRALVQSLENKWWIGKVSYIDRATHDRMKIYERHQAHLRAFLEGTEIFTRKRIANGNDELGCAGLLKSRWIAAKRESYARKLVTA